MPEAVIVGAVRTPIGRLRGALAAVRPDDLLAHALSALVSRTGIDPAEVDEVFAGCANQAGEDNRNVARMAWLIAGFPYEVAASTVNRLCASGLEAVVQAARAVRLGELEVAIAGGVESMTRAPWVLPKSAAPFGSGNLTAYDTALGWRFPNPRLEARFALQAMGETAETLAREYDIGREAQDRFALESHRRALAAADRLATEIAPLVVEERRARTTVERDEGPRKDTSLEQLGRLAPAFAEGGTVTAGNASPLSDGAAALLITTPERARARGWTPLATIAGAASSGVEPQRMGLGPVPATDKLLRRLDVRAADLDLVELNEAFAAQALAVMQRLALDPAKVNVNGGAIALGHPLGASGARLVTTLVHEMGRRDAALGLATLCVGVGQGTSVLLRR